MSHRSGYASVRVLAIDWSGAKSPARARSRIWLAEASEGSLLRLESGRDRDGIARHLIAEAEHDPNLVVGLDFAFSLPAWFLKQQGLRSAPELWQRVAEHGET